MKHKGQHEEMGENGPFSSTWILALWPLEKYFTCLVLLFSHLDVIVLMLRLWAPNGVKYILVYDVFFAILSWERLFKTYSGQYVAGLSMAAEDRKMWTAN